MVKSSIQTLIDAIKRNKRGFKVALNYNPRLPDFDEPSSEALSRFKTRIDRNIERVKAELPRVFRAQTSHKMKEVIRFLEA